MLAGSLFKGVHRFIYLDIFSPLFALSFHSVNGEHANICNSDRQSFLACLARKSKLKTRAMLAHMFCFLARLPRIQIRTADWQDILGFRAQAKAWVFFGKIGL